MGYGREMIKKKMYGGRYGVGNERCCETRSCERGRDRKWGTDIGHNVKYYGGYFNKDLKE